MTIGICSLWHNAAELLPEFERLLAPGGWDECILVDDASSMESARAYAASAERAGFGWKNISCPICRAGAGGADEQRLA